MAYFLLFSLAFLFSVTLTLMVRRFALYFRVLDIPGFLSRKAHTKPMPLLGGSAIFISFFILLFLLAWFTDLPEGKSIALSELFGVFLGACFLMIGGFLDDKYHLKPVHQIIWPILAALSIVFSGIEIHELTNPFGGVIEISPLISKVVIFLWLMVVMYTTKFLDGLDGLTAGVLTIGSAVIFSLALFTKFYQPEVAIISALLAGSALGFLLFNFHPAKIFLGEGGSTFTGFMLGVLAVISGGKIATALLVLGIPLMDLIWVVFRRVFKEKRSPFVGDRKHLHFRLLDLGFSHRGAVLFLYTLTAGFGFSTLFLQSFGKLVALLVMILTMAVLASVIVVIYRHKKTS